MPSSKTFLHLRAHVANDVSVLSDHGVDMEVIADSVDVNSTVTRSVHRHQIADKVARAAAAMDQISAPGAPHDDHTHPLRRRNG